MKRIILLSTAIVAGFVLADTAAAFGGRTGAMDRPGFAQIDTDGDGKISATEMQAFPAAQAEARFAAADANGDGTISKDELASTVGAAQSTRNAFRIDNMLARLDTDGDGVISKDEMLAMTGQNRAADPGSRFITRFDTDKDGAISAEEYAAAGTFMQMNTGRGGRDQMARGGHGGQSGRGGMGQRGGQQMPFWRN